LGMAGAPATPTRYNGNDDCRPEEIHANTTNSSGFSGDLFCEGAIDPRSAHPIPAHPSEIAERAAHVSAHARRACAVFTRAEDVASRKAVEGKPKLGWGGTLLSWPQVRVVLGEPDAQLLASSPPTMATPTSALADGQAMDRRGCRSQGRSCGRSTASCTSSTAPKFRLLLSNQ
jgi:hypothetical protein